MLMVGLSREETAMLIHRFAARIRLATSEEKLLQQTLKYIEQKVRRRMTHYLHDNISFSNLHFVTSYFHSYVYLIKTVGFHGG